MARLGGHIQRALFDLAVRIDPRLGPPIVGPRSAWVGLIVILLLVIGIAAVSGGAVWAIRETLPHREYRP